MAASRDFASTYAAKTELTTSIHYRIHSGELTFGNKIGAGSFGEVYEGIWQGKQVAIKKMAYEVTDSSLEVADTSLDETASTVKQFEKEKNMLQHLTELNAPNIITFYGFDYNYKNYFIVTEYMNNGSLAD